MFGGGGTSKDRRQSTVVTDAFQIELLGRLPDTFDKSKVKRKPKDTCMLCEAPFTGNLVIVNRNPIRHCKRCGKSVCQVCSESFKRLSKDDPVAYRICDQCDFEMQNWEVTNNLKQVKEATNDKIEILNSQVEQMHDNKEMLFEMQ